MTIHGPARPAPRRSRPDKETITMRTQRTRLATAGLLSLLAAATGAIALPTVVAAGGSVFRVNVAGDGADADLGDGICDTTPSPSTTKCSLRAAIQNANASADASEIRFKITAGASSIKTITPNSPLPTITAPLTIDGYSQPGSSVNTTTPGTNAVLKIQLDGRFITAAGLTANAPVTIKGLAIFFFGRGIQLSAGADGSRVLGNFIGTDATGTQDRGNDSSGILVNAADVRIGSIVRADKNLISGNTTSGINLGIASADAVVQGNLIGTSKNGRKALPNEGDGVFITGSDGHLIGGEFAGQGNSIGFNGGDGVNLISVTLSETLVPTRVRISSNSIHRNAGQGIDLGDDGLTPNDPVPDKDGGPNGRQNFPKVASAAQVADGTVIAGTLASKRNTSYEIQLFVNPAGDPQGRTLLSTFTVTTGGNGKVTWNRTVGTLKLGALVTATATDLGSLNTSELSPGRAVTP
jgi:hypothetical protein